MHTFPTAVAAFLGGFLAAFLSDCLMHAAENDVSLFAPQLCNQCGRQMEFWDRVPLLSWMLNGGKCRFCGAVRSLREPIISSLNIALWVVSFVLWMPYGPAEAMVVTVSVSGMLCACGLCCCSRSTQKPILLPLLLAMGILGVFVPDGLELGSHLIGAAAMLAFCLLLRSMTLGGQKGTEVRKDTVWYMSCVGLLMGWRSCFLVLPGGVIIGMLWSLIGRKKQRSLNRGAESKNDTFARSGVPYSTSLFLTGGGVIALVFGRVIMNWYLRLFN